MTVQHVATLSGHFISAVRTDIGGASPSRPSLIAGAVSVPSAIFCLATMKICTPGLRAPMLPRMSRTTRMPFRAASGYDQ
jgi:hypothetical protein